MTKPARRYEVYLPLTYNDGRPVENAKLVSVETRLLTRFTGLTTQQRTFPLRGVWQSRKRLYYDEIIVINVLDFRRGGSPQFLAQLKRALLQEFEQEEILITESSLRVH